MTAVKTGGALRLPPRSNLGELLGGAIGAQLQHAWVVERNGRAWMVATDSFVAVALPVESDIEPPYSVPQYAIAWAKSGMNVELHGKVWIGEGGRKLGATGVDQPTEDWESLGLFCEPPEDGSGRFAVAADRLATVQWALGSEGVRVFTRPGSLTGPDGGPRVAPERGVYVDPLVANERDGRHGVVMPMRWEG